MSDHFFSAVAPMILPGGVLAASLLGSVHCVGMCGGIIVNVARDARSLVLYHLGRLASYSALGAAAGLLGSTILRCAFLREAPWFASAAFGAILIFFGLRRLTGRTLHAPLPRLFNSAATGLIGRVLAKGGRAGWPFALGALSALLPCGWLYAFVLAAAATGSAALGAASLALFWLGTVPALSTVPLAFQLMNSRLRQLAPRLSGALMISVGLFALTLHASMLRPSTAPLNGIGHAAETGAACPLHRHAPVSQ